MHFMYRSKRLLGIILICIGIGIILVLILPFWAWLTIGGIALICAGLYFFRC